MAQLTPKEALEKVGITDTKYIYGNMQNAIIEAMELFAREKVAELEAKVQELQGSENQEELWDEIWELINAETPERVFQIQVQVDQN